MGLERRRGARKRQSRGPSPLGRLRARSVGAAAACHQQTHYTGSAECESVRRAAESAERSPTSDRPWIVAFGECRRVPRNQCI